MCCGSEEESWRYWSLKMKKVLGLLGSGVVSNRVSPVDMRLTEKPNGVVLWRRNVISELESESSWR